MRAAFLAVPFAAVSVLAVAGCDTEAGTPTTFQDVAVEARGDATLALEGGALVVSGLDGARSGGFTIPGTSSRVDVEIDPLRVPGGGEFGVVVEDDAGDRLASFYAVGTGGGALDFVFDFPLSTGVYAATVTYRLGGEDGEVVLRGTLDLPGERRVLARRPSGSVGEGSGDTGSTHVIRRNGRYVVVSDSDGGPGSRRECPGFTVTPPPSLDLEAAQVCTDWIEVEPLLEGAMPEGTVSVTARGVGSFTVRELDER